MNNCFECKADIRLSRSVNGRCLKCEGKTIIADMDKIYRDLFGANFISDRR